MALLEAQAALRDLVIATKRHLTKMEELVGAPWSELLEHLLWAEKEFSLPGGALVTRFGDPAFNVGTLRHMHSHIQVPDGSGPAFAVFGKLDPGAVDVQMQELQSAFTQKT